MKRLLTITIIIVVLTTTAKAQSFLDYYFQGQMRTRSYSYSPSTYYYGNYGGGCLNHYFQGQYYGYDGNTQKVLAYGNLGLGVLQTVIASRQTDKAIEMAQREQSIRAAEIRRNQQQQQLIPVQLKTQPKQPETTSTDVKKLQMEIEKLKLELEKVKLQQQIEQQKKQGK